MNIDALETFHALCTYRSFRGVASVLGITQPAVSARIKALEIELGARLVIRDRRGFRLTEEGKRTRRAAAEILASYQELRAALSETAGVAGVARIGVVDSIARTWLAALIRALEAAHPQLRAEIVVDTSLAIHAGLIEGDLALGVSIAPLDRPGVVDAGLGAYDMAWVARPDIVDPTHAYTPAEIAALPIISYSAGSPPDGLVEAYFRDEGCAPEHLNASNSMATMIWLAGEGLGLAPIPPVAVARHLTDGRLVELSLTKPFPPVHYWLSYVALPRNPLQRRLVAATRDAAAGFCAGQPRTHPAR